LEDQALVDAERQRGLVFQARMNTHKQKKLVPPSFKAITDGTPSHPLTTDSLNRLRQSKNGTLGRMIHVNVLPIMDGKASTWLPTFSEMYHTDKPVMGESRFFICRPRGLFFYRYYSRYLGRYE
jgi:hypothetical protein